MICEEDGVVQSGHCTCMAGLGEVCSHIGALLFYLESASRVSKSCTQIGCVWKEPRVLDSIPYAEIADIPFEKPKSQIAGCKRGAHLYSDVVPLTDLQLIEGTEKLVEEVTCTLTEDVASDELAELPSTSFPLLTLSTNETSSTTSLLSTASCNETSSSASLLPSEDGPSISSSSSSFMQLLLVPPSNEEQKELLSKISEHKPVICSIVSPYSDSFKPNSKTSNLPLSLRDLYQPQNEELTYDELLGVCELVTINVNNEDVTKIEMFTRDQSKSSAWYTQRAGRITASVMKSVCATNPGNPARSIINRVCYPDSTKFKTAATAWGCEHESSARTAYVSLMESTHTAFSCKESGLVVSLSHPFIGASPDGVVHCECCGHGVIEIKCPYCIRDEDPGTASCLLNGELSKKHAYFYQVQTQLFTSSASYADFIIATFDGQQANIFVERILPDKGFIEECIQKSEHFFKVCILPELLARWYSREEVMPTQTAAATTSLTTSGEYVYCYCKEDRGGEMVGCDNSECLHGKWFHLSCLKLKCAPRSTKWYCPNCRTLAQFSRKRSKKS